MQQTLNRWWSCRERVGGITTACMSWAANCRAYLLPAGVIASNGSSVPEARASLALLGPRAGCFPNEWLLGRNERPTADVFHVRTRARA